MKTLVASTLALAAMTSVALAGAPAANKATKGPVPLTAAQMDRVSAGLEINIGILGLGACGSRCNATGFVLFLGGL
jgi:hypothetical protein